MSYFASSNGPVHTSDVTVVLSAADFKGLSLSGRPGGLAGVVVTDVGASRALVCPGDQLVAVDDVDLTSASVGSVADLLRSSRSRVCRFRGGSSTSPAGDSTDFPAVNVWASERLECQLKIVGTGKCCSSGVTTRWCVLDQEDLSAPAIVEYKSAAVAVPGAKPLARHPVQHPPLVTWAPSAQLLPSGLHIVLANGAVLNVQAASHPQARMWFSKLTTVPYQLGCVVLPSMPPVGMPNLGALSVPSGGSGSGGTSPDTTTGDKGTFGGGGAPPSGGAGGGGTGGVASGAGAGAAGAMGQGSGGSGMAEEPSKGVAAPAPSVTDASASLVSGEVQGDSHGDSRARSPRLQARGSSRIVRPISPRGSDRSVSPRRAPTDRSVSPRLGRTGASSGPYTSSGPGPALGSTGAGNGGGHTAGHSAGHVGGPSGGAGGGAGSGAGGGSNTGGGKGKKAPGTKASPSSKGVLSPMSDGGLSIESTYSTDRGAGGGAAAATTAAGTSGLNGPVVTPPKRGKYMALASAGPIMGPDGVVFKQLDVKLRPVQTERVNADGEVVVSVGLGITLRQGTRGVTIASVLQPVARPLSPALDSHTHAHTLKRPPLLFPSSTLAIGDGGVSSPGPRGVEPGDVIISVNCESVAGKTVREVAQMMLCGPTRSGVLVRVAREDSLAVVSPPAGAPMAPHDLSELVSRSLSPTPAQIVAARAQVGAPHGAGLRSTTPLTARQGAHQAGSSRERSLSPRNVQALLNDARARTPNRRQGLEEEEVGGSGAAHVSAAAPSSAAAPGPMSSALGASSTSSGTGSVTATSASLGAPPLHRHVSPQRTVASRVATAAPVAPPRVPVNIAAAVSRRSSAVAGAHPKPAPTVTSTSGATSRRTSIPSHIVPPRHGKASVAKDSNPVVDTSVGGAFVDRSPSVGRGGHAGAVAPSAGASAGVVVGAAAGAGTSGVVGPPSAAPDSASVPSDSGGGGSSLPAPGSLVAAVPAPAPTPAVASPASAPVAAPVSAVSAAPAGDSAVVKSPMVPATPTAGAAVAPPQAHSASSVPASLGAVASVGKGAAAHGSNWGSEGEGEGGGDVHSEGEVGGDDDQGSEVEVTMDDDDMFDDNDLLLPDEGGHGGGHPGAHGGPAVASPKSSRITDALRSAMVSLGSSEGEGSGEH